MTNEAFAKEYPGILDAWSREEDPQVAGGESFADVEARVMPVIEQHIQAHAGETLLYVGHGNVFRVMLGAMLDVPAGKRNRIAQDYCAISTAEYDHERKRWNIRSVNKSILPEAI